MPAVHHFQSTMEVSKEEKLVVLVFRDRPSDSFHLWKLRMEAFLNARGYCEIVTVEEVTPTADTVEDGQDIDKAIASIEKREGKVQSWLINSLGDKPLKVVEKYAKNPD